MSPAANIERPTWANSLRKLAKSSEHKQLEKEWMEAIAGDDLTFDHYHPALLALSNNKEYELAEQLLWYLLEALQERVGMGAALEAARKSARLLPSRDLLRDQLLALYKSAYPDITDIEARCEMTLFDNDGPLDERVTQTENLLHMQPGAYVLDVSEAEIGRAAEFDARDKLLTVEFESGKRTFNSMTLRRLDPLPETHFGARAIFNPEPLTELSQEDPEALVLEVLNTYGDRVEWRDMKSHITDVLPGRAWTKWWTKAKKVLRRSDSVLTTEGTQPTFIRTKHVITFEERLRRKFDVTDAQERPALILQYLKELGNDKHEGTADLVAHVAPTLAEPEGDPLDAFISLAVLYELNRRFPETVPDELIFDVCPFEDTELVEMLVNVPDEDAAQCALRYVRDMKPEDWTALCAEAMLLASARRCDWMARELAAADANDILGATMEAVQDQTTRNPASLLWLWRVSDQELTKQLFPGIDRKVIAERLLWSGSSLGRAAADDAAHKALLVALRTAISANRFIMVQELLKGADDEAARQLLVATQNNAALGRDEVSEIRSMIKHDHPQLFARQLDPWEQEVVYTTSEGFERQKAIFQDLVHNKMMENRAAVAHAAAKGDLRENAEYSAALEERDRLSEAAQRMETDLAVASVIGSELAETGRVTVGSTVSAENLDTGQDETFTFLGPWDVDMEKRVFSYRAPLGQAFMGKEPGAEVELTTGHDTQRWRIKELAWNAV